MDEETTNLEAPASESALSQPSDALDNLYNLDFKEPGDELDNPADEGVAAETDSETDEPIDGQEADGTEAEGEETETEGEGGEAADAPEIADDVTVTVNGEKLALSELKSGYQRQADYSRKTQELGNQRRDLEALSTRVSASVEAIAEFLQGSIPKAPDPNLAITNPGQFVREKALHDNGMAQVAALIEKANAPKDALNQLTNEQRTEVLKTENAKLIEAFSETATPEGRKKFFEGTTTAAKELGFTDEELSRTTDHRLFKLAHYAKIGLAAEAAKAKAKQKVVNVPPVAPNKRPQSNAGASNREAMNRLSQTGSLKDAMKIDF